MIFSIIVIYNGMRNDWIQKCFDSLQNSKTPVRIVAIDNNSDDHSVAYIKENYPDVILIENKENKGFGGANNQGLKYALENNGEYFFLLNQDARINPDTISELLKVSKNNSEYGIISPIHLNGEGTALDYNFSNYITPIRCKNLYSDFVLKNTENTIYESGFICAAAWLLTKNCLKTVGGFNPTFFHYGEDDNYVHRLKFKNLKIGVHPKTVIYHDRENRETSHYASAEEELKRKWRIMLSNPFRKAEIQQLKKQLKNKLLKNRILQNTSEIKRLKKELSLLETEEKLTKENYEKSVSSEEFIFLT